MKSQGMKKVQTSNPEETLQKLIIENLNIKLFGFKRSYPTHSI